MGKQKNPFDILGATPRDNRRRLAYLAQDAALLQSEKEAQKAYEELLNPEMRLKAEIRWTGREENVLSLLNRAVQAFDVRKLKTLYVTQIADNIEKLCFAFCEADAQTVTAIINADRQSAGVLSTEENEVGRALDSYARALAQEIAQGMRPAVLGGVIIQLAKRSLVRDKGALAHNQLLTEVAAAYEMSVAAAMMQEREEVAAQVEKVQSCSSIRLEFEMDQLRKHMMRWNDMVLPLRKLNAARGMPHKASNACYWETRKTLQRVFNELRLMKISYQMVVQLRDCFSDVEELQTIIQEDYELVGNSYEIYRQNQNNKDTSLKKNLIGLLVILIVMVLFNLFTGGYVKEKPQKPSLPKAVQKELEKQQSAVKVHEYAMKALYRKQGLDLKAEMEECQKQMQEIMELHKVTPTAELMEQYQELKKTYEALEKEYNQKQASLDFLLKNGTGILSDSHDE